MSCASCTNFAAGAGADADQDPRANRGNDETGICRRYPPLLVPVEADWDSRFPIVHRHHHCGEHHMDGGF